MSVTPHANEILGTIGLQPSCTTSHLSSSHRGERFPRLIAGEFRRDRDFDLCCIAHDKDTEWSRFYQSMGEYQTFACARRRSTL